MRSTVRLNTSAVVLGADVNGLAQVRSLGKVGVPTAILCKNSAEPACRSRYAKACLLQPSSSLSDSDMLHVLTAYASRLDTQPVLLPSSDAYVAFVSRQHGALKGQFRFNIADNDTLEALSDKSRSHAIAGQAGLRVPETAPLSLVAHDTTRLRKQRYPAIIKPMKSYSIAFPWKTLVVKTRSELAAAIARNPELVPYAIMQEIVPGPENAIYQCTTYRGSRISGPMVVVQKYRQEPAGYGAMTFGRTCSNASVVANADRLLRAMRYRGFASIEFKQSSADDEWYMIEVNPRLPWYNGLFASSGVNFPFIAVRDLAGDDVSEYQMPECANDVFWLHWHNDVRGLWQRFKRAEWAVAMGGLMAPLRARSFAYFDLADLMPLLGVYRYHRIKRTRILEERALEAESSHEGGQNENQGASER